MNFEVSRYFFFFFRFLQKKCVLIKWCPLWQIKHTLPHFPVSAQLSQSRQTFPPVHLWAQDFPYLLLPLVILLVHSKASAKWQYESYSRAVAALCDSIKIKLPVCQATAASSHAAELWIRRHRWRMSSGVSGTLESLSSPFIAAAANCSTVASTARLFCCCFFQFCFLFFFFNQAQTHRIKVLFCLCVVWRRLFSSLASFFSMRSTWSAT